MPNQLNSQYTYARKLSVGIISVAFILSLIGPIAVLAAATPSLGMAATYGVLSSTYTDTSAATTVNGDVGYTTSPATAIGGTHTNLGSGAPYATAGTDQGTTLSSLASQPCTPAFTFGSTTDLSLLFQPLTPGVYCITGAASIGTGGITLSGSGTYIFRVDGALTSVASSSVTLAGDASVCDVFWTPTAATTLAANTTFAGTVIDDAGITVGANTTWVGRALAFGGTVTTDTNTITVPTCTAPTPTPTLTPTPSATPTPTTSPTPTPAPTTICYPDSENDLVGYIDADNQNGIITNSSSSCSYNVGFASYNMYDSNIDNQTIFDSQLAVIGPDQTITLTIDIPLCAYQVDLFYGDLITSFAGGIRYGDRLLDAGQTANPPSFCVVTTPTPSPTPTPTPGTGTIRVCKMIVNHLDQPVNGSILGSTTFTISGVDPLVTSNPAPISVFGTASFSTPLAYNADLIPGFPGDDARCVTYTDMPLGGYYYSQESITGAGSWLTPTYNDQYEIAVTTLSDFFPFDSNLYDGDASNDGSRDQNADGHLNLTIDRPDRTIVLLNQLPEEFAGAITVCKIVSDNTVNPGAAFTINSLIPPVSSVAAPVSTFGTSVFTMPLTLNTDLLSDMPGNDAQCITYDNLPLGGYHYSQESRSGPGTWEDPRYNDIYEGVLETLSDFFIWDGNLYDGDASNDSLRNQNADGHLNLTAERPHRMIAVYNKVAPTPPITITLTTNGGGGGGGSGGGVGGGGELSFVPTPTPIPNPGPEIAGANTGPLVAGATTELPGTGFTSFDLMFISFFSAIVMSGIFMTLLGSNRLPKVILKRST